MAETVVRYGLPVFILCLPLEVTSVYLHLQLARIVLLAVALLCWSLYSTGLSLWRPDPAMLGRVNATFADPNITARFLTLAVAIAVFMFAGRRQKTWLVVSVALAGTAALPLTFSKSGFLIFPVTVVLA